MNNANDKQRKALGKGLSSLLPARAQSTAPAPAPEAAPTSLWLEEIKPNPMQPRNIFNPNDLLDLAASIKANGIIQPLIVRKHGEGYQIVAGERRWRAAKLAGLHHVPVVVQDVTDPQLLQLALIENIQRADLNPIECAVAFDRLSRELGLSQEEIGTRTGKDRASIANFVRLLKLPSEVQLLIAERKISMGHAKALLALTNSDDQVQVAERIATQGLSVRQAETLVQSLAVERPKESPKKESVQDPNIRAAVEEMARALGTKIRIVEQSEQRGRIEIEYYSQSDLDRLYQQILGN